MKFALMTLATLFSTLALAGQSVCTGKVFVSNSQISYQAKFTDSHLQEQGAVKKATLNCK